MRKKARGFTLIEIIIAIIILGVLSAVVVPKYFSIRESTINASKDAAKNIVKSALGVAIFEKGKFPRVIDLAKHIASKNIVMAVASGVQVVVDGKNYIVQTCKDDMCQLPTTSPVDEVRCVGSVVSISGRSGPLKEVPGIIAALDKPEPLQSPLPKPLSLNESTESQNPGKRQQEQLIIEPVKRSPSEIDTKSGGLPPIQNEYPEVMEGYLFGWRVWFMRAPIVREDIDRERRRSIPISAPSVEGVSKEELVKRAGKGAFGFLLWLAGAYFGQQEEMRHAIVPPPGPPGGPPDDEDYDLSTLFDEPPPPFDPSSPLADTLRSSPPQRPIEHGGPQAPASPLVLPPAMPLSPPSSVSPSPLGPSTFAPTSSPLPSPQPGEQHIPRMPRDTHSTTTLTTQPTLPLHFEPPPFDPSSPLADTLRSSPPQRPIEHGGPQAPASPLVLPPAMRPSPPSSVSPSPLGPSTFAPTLSPLPSPQPGEQHIPRMPRDTHSTTTLATQPTPPLHSELPPPPPPPASVRTPPRPAWNPSRRGGGLFSDPGYLGGGSGGAQQGPHWERRHVPEPARESPRSSERAHVQPLPPTPPRPQGVGIGVYSPNRTPPK